MGMFTPDGRQQIIIIRWLRRSSKEKENDLKGDYLSIPQKIKFFENKLNELDNASRPKRAYKHHCISLIIVKPSVAGAVLQLCNKLTN